MTPAGDMADIVKKGGVAVLIIIAITYLLTQVLTVFGAQQRDTLIEIRNELRLVNTQVAQQTVVLERIEKNAGRGHN